MHTHAQLCPTLCDPIYCSLCPWDFSGKNTGVSCHFFLQEIFLTQVSNPRLLCLLHCRRILYHLCHWGINFIYMSIIWTGLYWKDWCWGWNSNTLATSCEELTHWKRPWCWEGLGAGGEGDDRGWDGWMASPTRYTWVWVNSGSWWWTERPGVLWFMGSQRVEQTERLNWTVAAKQSHIQTQAIMRVFSWDKFF